jgi:predicted CxxxxCH...CXXCH cytochrome family protein
VAVIPNKPFVAILVFREPPGDALRGAVGRGGRRKRGIDEMSSLGSTLFSCLDRITTARNPNGPLGCVEGARHWPARERDALRRGRGVNKRGVDSNLDPTPENVFYCGSTSARWSPPGERVDGSRPSVQPIPSLARFDLAPLRSCPQCVRQSGRCVSVSIIYYHSEARKRTKAYQTPKWRGSRDRCSWAPLHLR